MEIGFEIDASPLTGFLNNLYTAAEAGLSGDELHGGFEKAQSLYLEAQRERFEENSRGGGEWADLSPSTKLGRYYSAGGRFKRERGVSRADRLNQVSGMQFSILNKTGGVLASLSPGDPQNILHADGDAMLAGTAVPRARFHNSGGARLPQRRILHDPTAQLLEDMTMPVTDGFRLMIYRAAGLSGF